ncbi:conserved protein of unknown function [Cupriavidus taiwanensis]|nr:conserved protein of unknown function [Cupriavidus taiwanensis]
MHAAGHAGLGLAQLADIAEEIQRHAADRRQENLQVRPRHQFREHAAGLLEQAAAQHAFLDAEAGRHAGQVPHRVDRRLGHPHVAIGMQQVAVGLEPARGDGRNQFRHVDVRTGHRDGRADIDAGGDAVGKDAGDQVSPRVQRNDLVRVAPLRMRADGFGGCGIGQVGTMVALQRAGGDREGAVDGIGAGVRADHIALRRIAQAGDHRSALRRREGAPVDRLGRLVAARVRSQDDMVGHDTLGSRWNPDQAVRFTIPY